MGQLTDTVQTAKNVADSSPRWLDALILAAGWLVSLLQPVAIVVTIAWGLLQIYLAIEKRWFPPKT